MKLYIFFFFLFTLLFKSPSIAVDVKAFGAKGDGLQDDTEAIYRAMENMDDGELFFSRGIYRISSSIEIDLEKYGPMRIRGIGSGSTVIMEGDGAAFRILGTHRGSANPVSVEDKVWEKEKMFLIESIEITGENESADGIELNHLMQPIVQNCLIREVRYGIHLTEHNRNVLIQGNHIYNNSGIGIYLNDLNLHQINIENNHISYNKAGGVKVRSGEIRNFQIVGNDIEYNYDLESSDPVGDLFIDLSEGGSVREGTVSGNTIQAVKSENGVNVLFTGDPEDEKKIGLWSITGNHISHQENNIVLRFCQGINITGNTFILGFERNIVIEDSKNIVIEGNVFDDNEDYYVHQGREAAGGWSVLRSKNIIGRGNIINNPNSEVTPDLKSAILMEECFDFILEGNMIGNPSQYGVEIRDSEEITIRDCVIQADRGIEDFKGSVLLTGDCSGTFLEGNKWLRGKEGAIINKAEGVEMGENRIK